MTATETKHTPGKLKFAWGGADPDVLTEAGDLFAAVYTDERADADAARIALTWNCHDDLVAELKRADRELDDEACVNRVTRARAIIQAALAKVPTTP